MAEYGSYTRLDLLKAELHIGTTDEADDANLLRCIERASRQIDDHCRRHFYAVTETRYYSPVSSVCLRVDDLLSVTSLATDEDDDRDYDYTWAATDYDLIPDNGFPKWRIETTPLGSYRFPVARRSVKIVGLFGYGDGYSATPYIATGATVTIANTTSTTVTVSDDSLVFAGDTLLAGTEQMYVTQVTAGATDSVTVVRGVNGTTAAIQAAAAASRYLYPQPIVNACTRLAARLFRMQAAPFGVEGTGEFGTATVIGSRFDSAILQDLAPYRRLEYD